MNKYILKPILGLVLLSAFWGACTEMDAYKDFVREGEKTYSGKVDSLTVIGGDNKVMIWGLLKADPKITEARISWSAGSESVTIPIDRTTGVDTIKYIIDEMSENNYTFEVVTIDRNGNESVPVYASGSSYGERDGLEQQGDGSC